MNIVGIKEVIDCKNARSGKLKKIIRNVLSILPSWRLRECDIKDDKKDHVT